MANDPLLCTSCYCSDEVLVENVNGRCDRCGGTDWAPLWAMCCDQCWREYEAGAGPIEMPCFDWVEHLR